MFHAKYFAIIIDLTGYLKSYDFNDYFMGNKDADLETWENYPE